MAMPTPAPSAEVFVIAEAGVNHNGDVRLAHRLVEAAAQTGADAVKFQTFSTDDVVTPDAPLAEYQERSTAGSQRDMIAALELPPAAFVELRDHAEELGLEFMSTAFDDESLRLLVEEVAVSRIKIPSGELTNTPFVMRCARTRLPLILSTGMADLSEVAFACDAIAFARAHTNDPDGAHDIVGSFDLHRERDNLATHLTLLHCTTAYPAPIASVNLRAMTTMSAAFGLPVGYSDHTLGTEVAIAAAALGASVIEKHLTLDRTLPGPDHEASTEPAEFAAMVERIRNITCALGDGVKAASEVERSNMVVARRVLLAARDLAPGHPLTPQDIRILRHGNGMSPEHYWDVLGRTTTRGYRAFEPLDEPAANP